MAFDAMHCLITFILNNDNNLYTSANSIQCSNALHNKITVQKSDTIINTTIRIKQNERE